MTQPLIVCDLRKAFDTRDWSQIDSQIEYNRDYYFGVCSIFSCNGHGFFKKRFHSLTEKEMEIVNRRINKIMEQKK